MLEAVAAAGFDVPVEAFVASLDHAAAFAVLSVFVSEPVLSSFAFDGGAFTSASVSVPVLAECAFFGWAAEALTAFMVPEVVGSTVAGVSTDALAEMVIEELTIAAEAGVQAHAVAVVLAPEETFRAGLWLATAAAVVVIEYFVVTANLRSADAIANRLVVELSHWVWAC